MKNIKNINNINDIERNAILLDIYLDNWDKRLFIPLNEIYMSGLFDSIEEISVFFYSFDGVYYSTDIALLKEFGQEYIDYLEENGLNRLSIR